ncbi:MAG: hypothetical protein WCJ54_01590 [Actinomycetota bacterium]
MKIYAEYIHPLVRKAIKIQSEEIDLEQDLYIRDFAVMIEKKHKLKNLLIDDKTRNLKVSVLINGVNAGDNSYTLKDNDRVHFMVFTTGG